MSAESVVLDALDRWGHTPRRWRLGAVAEATVLGDRDRLVAALDALLENAVAHTEPGDTIEVSVRLEGGNVVLAVTDSGCGIPPTELDRIFRRFARAEPAAAARPAGSGSAWPSCRRSPKPTTARSGCTAPAARARRSRWSFPPSPTR